MVCFLRRELEVMGARKNWAREEDTRVSLACPVLSCAHYFQTPATQARREENRVPEEKCLKVRGRRTHNKFNPHTASTPRFEPGGPEASSLTTAPRLLSMETRKLALADVRVKRLNSNFDT